MRDPERWTARDFLRAAAEFERLTPDRGTWTLQGQADNAPRWVRLRRLQALAKAFELEPGFEVLWSDGFVERRPFEAYQPVIQHIVRECETLFPDVLRSAHQCPPHLWDVEHVYRKLFKFLTKHAYPMLDFNGGVLEASGFYLYSVLRVDHSLAGVPELIRPIEDLVGLIIDPARRSFSTQELVAYGWPPDNLFMVDLDNI